MTLGPKSQSFRRLCFSFLFHHKMALERFTERLSFYCSWRREKEINLWWTLKGTVPLLDLGWLCFTHWGAWSRPCPGWTCLLFPAPLVALAGPPRPQQWTCGSKTARLLQSQSRQRCFSEQRAWRVLLGDEQVHFPLVHQLGPTLHCGGADVRDDPGQRGVLLRGEHNQHADGVAMIGQLNHLILQILGRGGHTWQEAWGHGFKGEQRRGE